VPQSQLAKVSKHTLRERLLRWLGFEFDVNEYKSFLSGLEPDLSDEVQDIDIPLWQVGKDLLLQEFHSIEIDESGLCWEEHPHELGKKLPNEFFENLIM
jgi:hypothetical protein